MCYLCVLVTGIAYFVVCFVCVLGNILVVLSVFTYRPLQNVQNYFIVSLALADTFVAAFVMPFHISFFFTDGNWIFGFYVCQFFLTLDILLCTASILHLCCIALDRYWAIKDSIKYAQKRTMRRVLLMIFISWLLSALISLPVIFWNRLTRLVRLIFSSFTSATSPSDTHSTTAATAAAAAAAVATLTNTATTTSYHLLVGNGEPSLSAGDATDQPFACDIPNDKLYRIYSSMGTFFVPLFIMTFVYLQIYLETKRRLHERVKTAQKLAKTIQQQQTPMAATGDGVAGVGAHSHGALARLLHCLVCGLGYGGGASDVTNESCKEVTSTASVVRERHMGDRQLEFSNSSIPSSADHRRSSAANQLQQYQASLNGKLKQPTTMTTTTTTSPPGAQSLSQPGAPQHSRVRRNSKFKINFERISVNTQNEMELNESGLTASHRASSIIKPPQHLQLQAELSSCVAAVAPMSSPGNEFGVEPIARLSLGGGLDLAGDSLDASAIRRKSTLSLKFADDLPTSKQSPPQSQLLSTSNNNNNNTNNNGNGNVTERLLATPSTQPSKEMASRTKTLQQRQQISLTRERKAARTLGIIMGAFIICWAPFFVVYLLQTLDLVFHSRLIDFLTLLGYFNSALNPIIYTIFNMDFRKSFKRIIFGCILFKRETYY